MLAHMTVKGLTQKSKILDELEERATSSDQFTGELWPLTLELHHLGHHKRLDAHRKAGNDIVAAWHAAKASIIEWDRTPRVFDHEESEGDPEDWEPNFAIEDFASAYDGEDEDEDEDDDTPDDDFEMPF